MDCPAIWLALVQTQPEDLAQFQVLVVDLAPLEVVSAVALLLGVVLPVLLVRPLATNAEGMCAQSH